MLGLIAASAVGLGFWLLGFDAAPVMTGVALLGWTGYAAVTAAIMIYLARNVRLPVWAAVSAVLWGGSAAVFAQLFALATRDAVANALGSSREAWTSALAAPLPEEVFKVVGVVLLMAAAPALRSPLCGMVLGALVGIGFNAAEGFAFSVSEMARSASWEPLWSDLLVRGLLTGLVTHAGLTAIVGAGIGYTFGAVDVAVARRAGVFVGLLVAAVLLHALIDTPLLDHWGIAGLIVKQVPVIGAFWGIKDFGRTETLRLQRRVRQ